MKVVFRKRHYEIVFSDHAKTQMELRNLDETTILDIIETGKVKEKGTKNKFWVFKEIKGRKDNMISVALVIENPHLIVITAMVNWRPK